jgi:HD-GYP domain-containing protein (c-di-GMP phosphodiesterase class II)
MPIVVRVEELQPGMCLKHPLLQGSRVMLAPGTALEEWHINSLRRRFPNLTVQICDPVLDDMVEFQDDSHDHEVAATVNRQMSRLMTRVRELLGRKTALDGSDVFGLQKAIAKVMEYINENPGTAAILTRFNDASEYLRGHVGNVFYVSLLVGNLIRDYIYRERQRCLHNEALCAQYIMNLTPLALGCLFHDLGMLPIEYLYQKTEPLTPEERELIRNHPNVGVSMLPKDLDAVAKMVVRTHHENMDGTGYPQGIPVESLHVFSRVIRATDALDAGTSRHTYKQAKSAARVLWEMSSGPMKDHYDPAIVKILMAIVQPFPIGAKIRMNCGRYGVVVRHNRKFPFRPTIIIAFDELGRKLKKKELQPPIDMARDDQVQLVEFDGDDLTCLSQGPDDLAWGSPEISPEEKESFFAMAYP